ncbi:MAG: alpha-1,4-glucan--maltose-1-phosphate maltosyltransferase [Rhodospirillales bacterium]
MKAAPVARLDPDAPSLDALSPDGPSPDALSQDAASPSALTKAASPAQRVAIEAISPSVDNGRFAVKRTIGESLIVEADIFADGHEQLSAAVEWRLGADKWNRVAMAPVVNDRWRANLPLKSQGIVQFRVEAQIDSYGGFVRDTARKLEAGLALNVEAQEGRALLAQAQAQASGAAKSALSALLTKFDAVTGEAQIALLLADAAKEAVYAVGAGKFVAHSDVQEVRVERQAASFASWYELFPRSQSATPGRHGSLRDVIAQLPRIQAMGFDVLYMPPIHPIGTANRKGANNALTVRPGDPGSPYAIGSPAGGHDALHPELGSLEDFRALVAAARDHGMELALDFAVQMSPDHPWLKQHPEWFTRRPDGTIKYAENPPKKYEDIVNPDFYADDALWNGLRDIFLHWIDQGVRIFRVDNPHTKPLPFWQWLIADIQAKQPDTIFLAEAFTRPKPMYRLAKIGFTQSYTYFTWRNTKQELTDYLTELNAAPVRDFFRPHFFVNTPDINPPFLQTGGRPAFLIRAALAATLSGLWGIYSGFEICEAAPLPGREEYQDSEKYQLRQRNYAAPGNIVREIAQLNALRAVEPALHSHLGVSFYNAFNDNILYYGKAAPGHDERLLIAVNLDPHHAQACDFEIPLWEWGLPDTAALQVEDLLHGYHFTWSGKLQTMRLEPAAPYAIWRVRPARKVAS